MRKLTPQTANTIAGVCKLKRDNISTRSSWILVDDQYFTIVNQRTGQDATGKVRLSKKEFDKFISAIKSHPFERIRTRSTNRYLPSIQRPQSF